MIAEIDYLSNYLLILIRNAFMKTVKIKLNKSNITFPQKMDYRSFELPVLTTKSATIFIRQY